jgi:hypothetical protein
LLSKLGGIQGQQVVQPVAFPGLSHRLDQLGVDQCLSPMLNLGLVDPN